MFTIQRAIIMAAGKGERMRPVTSETPKPLVRVNGQRMIDTVIRALRQNGIYEIYIVVGYLKEQFLPLTEEYPGVTLIENPYYERCNNISSLYVAREHLKDVMILDGDQIIFRPELLAPQFQGSGYHCVWTEGETNEWLLRESGGLITDCSRTGGRGGWQLYSISRWTEADGAKLKADLELEFEEKKNRSIYWDDVALFCHRDRYQLRVIPMEQGDVLEIDSLQELSALDPSYVPYLKGRDNQ